MSWNLVSTNARMAASDRMAGSRPSPEVPPRRPTVPAWFAFGIAALLEASPSMAHHSGVMFDQEKQITLSGSVKQFQWTNPHCWIQVIVDSGDTTTEWSVQMGAPTELFRGGWRPGTLKAGDQIRVVIHPARTDVKAGMFISATDSSGKPLGKKAG